MTLFQTILIKEVHNHVINKHFDYNYDIFKAAYLKS